MSNVEDRHYVDGLLNIETKKYEEQEFVNGLDSFALECSKAEGLNFDDVELSNSASVEDRHYVDGLLNIETTKHEVQEFVNGIDPFAMECAKAEGLDFNDVEPPHSASVEENEDCGFRM
jgi:hypothetical protein